MARYSLGRFLLRSRVWLTPPLRSACPSRFKDKYTTIKKTNGTIKQQLHSRGVIFAALDSYMKTRYIVSLLALLLSFTQLTAQEVPIGNWQSYLPCSLGRSVAQSTTNVYYACENSLIVIDKEDLSVQRFDKLSGLSTIGVRFVEYHQPTETLLVIYDDSSIDLIRNGETTYLTDISRDDIVGDKRVFSVDFYQNKAFISTGFGLLQLDLEQQLFLTTTLTSNTQVNGFAQYENTYFISTLNGVFSIPENGNILDFAAWTLADNSVGMPATYSSQDLNFFQNSIVAAVQDSIYRYRTSTGWQLFYHDPALLNSEIRFLNPEENEILVGFDCSNCPDQLRLVYPSGTSYTPNAPDCINFFLDALIDEQDRIWTADLFRNVGYINENGCNSYSINAPIALTSQEFAIGDDNSVWVASGLVGGTYQPGFNSTGVYTYIDGFWDFINRTNHPLMNGSFNFIEIELSQDDRDVYFGAFTGGLFIYNRDTETVQQFKYGYLDSNPLDTSAYRVAGLAVDENNNLWISNYNVGDWLKVRKSDGTWRSFAPSGSAQLATQIVIDDNGYKWIIGARGEGIFVYDEGEDIDSPSDDRFHEYTTSNSVLPTANVRSLALDKNGDMWVGTEQGVIVFECTSQVFDNTCPGTIKTFNPDDFNDYLLATEIVTSIAVDGANRKWFGTTNGVFLLSPNGDEELAYYTKTNSPLLGNIITDIQINDNTGDVFFATDQGICSFRGEATGATRVHASNVYAFPNPVRPDYQGKIAIQGLAENANVKITDINGRLVFETTALGGQAIWDGNSYDGRRAASGVYLVFSTGTRGLTPDTEVTKILFVD